MTSFSIKLCDNLNETEHSLLTKYYGYYKKKYESDSGIDLIIPRNYYVEPLSTIKINLGIQVKVNDKNPHGYYLYPRSSISKTTFRMANSVGIIDYTYRGELIAVIDNISELKQKIETGTKLFQLCLPDLSPASINLVDELDMTARGSNGFGSTNH
jgi:dUTP pyrophosphatase